MASVNKEFLLNDSKTFCMFPWIHLYVSPKGDVYPCCTTDQSSQLGNVKDNSLKEIFNNDKVKQIRLNMLNEKPTDLCRTCYRLEESTSHSYRSYSKHVFGKHFDEMIAETNEDGSVNKFQMKFLDIRFSNICNFKCRTCGSECSSQWAAEDKRVKEVLGGGPSHEWIVLHADDHKGRLLEEVLSHLPNVDMVYFAGGEPLITDEHYLILEEIIRLGKTDIKLRYNTNCSNTKYKSYDLLDLWKRFDSIELSCSVDHYGAKAEYIRHGTDWGVVESNLIKFRELSNVNFSISTVLSVFNYVTLADFYHYMKRKQLILPQDHNTYLTFTSNPMFYSATSLPKELKDLGTERIRGLIPVLNSGNWDYQNYIAITNFLNQSIDFVYSKDTYMDNKKDFMHNTKVRDTLRNENFVEVFPELAEMVNG